MEENTMKYGDTIIDTDTITELTVIALVGMAVTGVVVGVGCYKGVRKICTKIQEHKLNKKLMKEEEAK